MFNVKRYFQVLGISLAVIVVAAAVCMGINFDRYGEFSEGKSSIMADVDNGK